MKVLALSYSKKRCNGHTFINDKSKASLRYGACKSESKTQPHQYLSGFGQIKDKGGWRSA